MTSILRKIDRFSLILWAVTLCFVSDIAVITLDPPGPVRPVFSYLLNQTSDGEEVQFPVHRRFLVRGENGIDDRLNTSNPQFVGVPFAELVWLAFQDASSRVPSSIYIPHAGPPAWFPIPLRC